MDICSQLDQVDVPSLCVRPEASLRETLRVIDRSGKVSLALIVDEAGRLIHTVTDGDVRRAILSGIGLDTPVSVLLPLKANLPQSKPVTASCDTPLDELLRIMEDTGVRQIVLLKPDGAISNVALLRDLLPQKRIPLQAMIMAGGYGKRLLPLTEDTPKPMLPVGEKPLMEHIVEGLKGAGIHQILVTTHFHPEKIVDHFGSGTKWGVDMRYVHEDRPLGTGGALGRIDRPTTPLLIINGDILTQVDFAAMLAFHEENRADMTVGLRHYGFKVPYGVVEVEGCRIQSLREKPQLDFFVNAGIYLLSPSVFDILEDRESYHLTDVVDWLLRKGKTVVGFPILEQWLDIGQHEDYARAQKLPQEQTPSKDRA